MKSFLCFVCFLLVIACAQGNASSSENAAASTTDPGVVINGIRWATRNIDSSGNFISSPESFGGFYRWNNSTSYDSTGIIRRIRALKASGTSWTYDNVPCPPGWRVPTKEEFQSLIDSGSVWTTINGVNGRLFGTVPNQIFLPAAGFRSGSFGARFFKGTHGGYWSSTQTEDSNAWFLSFNSEILTMFNYSRARWFSIRCVAE